ncbi:MAG: DNA polymerase III subunit beta [Clostridia bacterium]|nr:DNA polymerase III subunit beta [Clostridia bacterium]
MQFTCDRAVLYQGVQTAARAVLGRSSLPILEGILMELSPDCLKLTGYDMETGIRCAIPVNSYDSGTLLLPCSTFSDILRKLPEGEVSISTEGDAVTIRSGFSVFHISSTPHENYPPVHFGREGFSFAISQKALRSCIAQTVFAVSTSDSKPVHTGCLFHLEEDRLEVVGVDGYRLAMRTETLDFPVDAPVNFVVPARTLQDIGKILGDSDEEVLIWPSKRSVLFESENITVVTRTIEGEFLNYKNVIPKIEMFTLNVNVRSFLDCLDRASLLITEKQRSPVRLFFKDNEMQMTCITPIGSVSDKMMLDYSREAMEIGFNNRFLLDAFRNTGTSEVRVQLAGSLSPMIILPPDEGDESFLFLILPVRLRG